MKTKRILTLLTAALLVLSLAACGTGKDSKKDDSGKKAEIAALLAAEPATADEAAELHQKLMEVLAEYADGALLCLLRQFIPYFTLDGRRDQTVITVCNCLIEIACTIMLHISDNLLYKTE